jgi:hypothetical protein
MTLAIILVVAAALALVLILRVTLSRSLQISADVSLADQIQPIDIEAFRNLVDPEENSFLRRRLSARAFRAVQRERLYAMAAYVRTVGRNADILIRISQSALNSSDTRAVEAARQLADQALLLRRNVIFALARIYVALAWPTSGLAAAPLVDSYERMSGSAMLLGRLQNPTAPVRISAS